MLIYHNKHSENSKEMVVSDEFYASFPGLPLGLVLYLYCSFLLYIC